MTMPSNPGRTAPPVPALADRAHAAQAVLARHADALDGFPVAAAMATWPLQADTAPRPLLCLLERWCAHLDEDIAGLAQSRHASVRPALERLAAAREAIAALIDELADAGDGRCDRPGCAAGAGTPPH